MSAPGSEPPPAPGPDDAPVHLSAALRYVDGDMELLEELVETFQEDVAERIQQLQEAIRSGDQAVARRAAHSFRGSLAILGADPAMGLAERLEMLGLEGRLDEAARILPGFEAEMARVTACLRSPEWKRPP